jgi:hypothetical protein
MLNKDHTTEIYGNCRYYTGMKTVHVHCINVKLTYVFQCRSIFLQPVVTESNIVGKMRTVA